MLFPSLNSQSFTPRPLLLPNAGPHLLRKRAENRTPTIPPLRSRLRSLSHTDIIALDVDALLDACRPPPPAEQLSPPTPREPPSCRTPPPSSRALFPPNKENDPERTPRPHEKDAQVLSHRDSLTPSPDFVLHEQAGKILFPTPPLKISKTLPKSPPTLHSARHSSMEPPPPPPKDWVTPASTPPSSQQHFGDIQGFDQIPTLPSNGPFDLPLEDLTGDRKPPSAVFMSRSTNSSRSSHTTASSMESDGFQWSLGSPSTAPTSPASSPRSLHHPPSMPGCPLTGRGRSGSDFSLMSAVSEGLSTFSLQTPPLPKECGSGAVAVDEKEYHWSTTFDSPFWNVTESDVSTSSSSASTPSCNTRASSPSSNASRPILDVKPDQLFPPSNTVRNRKSLVSLKSIFRKTPNRPRHKSQSSVSCEEPLPPRSALDLGLERDLERA